MRGSRQRLSSDHHDAGNHERGTKKTVICIWGRACPDTGIQRCERFDPQGKELAEQLHAFVPSQFSNPYNPKSHYETTGPEIWADTDGKIDVFVAGVGTGGTISGTGRYLKEKNPNIQIVAVEPAGSPVLSDGIPGRHKIQGIGAGFIPETLDMEIYDEILTVTDDDAYQACRELARREGVLCGISSGAALSAAKELAVKPAYQGKTIVALFPDGGERYLSSGVFDE